MKGKYFDITRGGAAFSATEHLRDYREGVLILKHNGNDNGEWKVIKGYDDDDDQVVHEAQKDYKKILKTMKRGGLALWNGTHIILFVLV